MTQKGRLSAPNQEQQRSFQPLPLPSRDPCDIVATYIAKRHHVYVVQNPPSRGILCFLHSLSARRRCRRRIAATAICEPCLDPLIWSWTTSCGLCRDCPTRSRSPRTSFLSTLGSAPLRTIHFLFTSTATTAGLLSGSVARGGAPHGHRVLDHVRVPVSYTAYMDITKGRGLGRHDHHHRQLHRHLNHPSPVREQPVTRHLQDARLGLDSTRPCCSIV